MNAYPRELHVDMSKLRQTTLKRYAWYFKLDSAAASAPAVSRPELASSCAKHFQAHYEVDEQQVLSNFEAYIVNPNAAKRGAGSGNVSPQAGAKRALGSPDDEDGPNKKRRGLPIPENRLVAAKVSDNYILARVLKYLKRKKMYRVEDADEVTKDRPTFELLQEHVVMLPTEEELLTKKSYPKGARVLARFPKTSTFYPATVVKRADKSKYHLRFDEDEAGPDGNIRVMKVSAVEVVTAN